MSNLSKALQSAKRANDAPRAQPHSEALHEVAYAKNGVAGSMTLAAEMPGAAKAQDRVVHWLTAGSSNITPARLIQLVQAGLPIYELDDLLAKLAVPMEKLGPMLGISKATLHRRRLGERLGVPESDRVVRFARLMGKAVGVFESEEQARQWLNSPQFGLGGAVPLEYAETEVGAREVESLLGRIDYGVYS